MSLIELKGVEKTYDPGKPWQVQALRGVNAEFVGGGAYALMGDSGSGKTTLLNIIGCLDRPSAGKCLWDGRDLGELSPKALARLRAEKIGFVLQDFGLVPHMTGVANCEMPAIFAGASRREARRRVDAVAERLNIPFINRRVDKLSGGQKQRVAIARAIVNRPKLVLADEPTGALDTQNAKIIIGELLSLRDEDTTVIIATHNPEAAALCDSIRVIRDGVIV